MEHNLTYEKRLLDWLGYTIINEEENKWIIKDDKDKVVGKIEYGPFDKNKGCEVISYTNNGYHMIIDSDTISYNSARDIDHKIYRFKVKDIGSVCLRLGPKTYMCMNDQLAVFTDKYGDYYLKISKDSFENGVINSEINALRIYYTYNINGYEVSERSHLRNKRYSDNNSFKSYRYELTYNKENEDANRNGHNLFAYTDNYDPEQMLHIWEYDFGTKKDMIPREEKYKTVEKFAIEDGRGIELFNRLRKLSREILPFKVDIFYEILKDDIKEYGLESFFEEDIKKLRK